MSEQRSSDEERYAHLQANVLAQKQGTVDRLSRAIATLEAEGHPASFTIKEVSGLDYMAYYRNAEALVLFRTHSTHLRNEREQMEQRYHALLQEHMQRGLTITRLEAQLAEHLAFMDSFRSSLKQEEHGSQQ